MIIEASLSRGYLNVEPFNNDKKMVLSAGTRMHANDCQKIIKIKAYQAFRFKIFFFFLIFYMTRLLLELRRELLRLVYHCDGL